MLTRRQFCQQVAAATGSVVLLPYVSSCSSAADGGAHAVPSYDVPVIRPAGWDPVAFNRGRGNAGAIPESYHASINGPDGVKKHLGKHLPYVPTLDGVEAPDGFLPLMWGNPELGFARHPNAVRNEGNNFEGHWYNWIKVRKSSNNADELQSTYSEWPGTKSSDNGAYAVFGGGDINADGGRNTIYMAALPSDVKKGDTVRIHAHCLTHGEYVDFLTL